MERKNKLYMMLGIAIVGMMTLLAMTTVTVEAETYPFPDDFGEGGLMFMDCQPFKFPIIYYFIGRSNDHVALYLGDDYNHNGVIGGWFLHTGGEVEFKHWAVGHCFLDKFKNFEFWKVNVNENIIQAAVNTALAIEARDDTYQTGGDHEKTPYAPGPKQEWYCSEFIWACYYDAGVDIDENGDEPDFPRLNPEYDAVWMGWPIFWHQNDIKAHGLTEKL